jgi:Glyoxalase/Bleomycin resistance protein/Dioxygenase superfamily
VALDYLLKPVSQERFAAALNRARDRVKAPPHAGEQRYSRRFLVERRKSAYFLPTDSIGHIVADRNYALLHSELGEVAIRATIEGLEKRLDRITVWFNLDSKDEVDELYRRWRDAGARIIEEPEDKPWLLREFRVADLDGNQLSVFYGFSCGPTRRTHGADDLVRGPFGEGCQSPSMRNPVPE